jgi:hypothetical protein
MPTPSSVLRVSRFARNGISASTKTSEICPMVISPPPPTPKMLLIVVASLVWYAPTNGPV